MYGNGAKIGTTIKGGDVWCVVVRSMTRSALCAVRAGISVIQTAVTTLLAFGLRSLVLISELYRQDRTTILMPNQLDFLDIDALKDGFTWLCFERIIPEKNEHRYYAIGWQPTLYHDGAIVRISGRLGVTKRVMAPMPFDSLDEAWPTIAKLIERRLKRGYQVVEDLSEIEPVIRVAFQWLPSPIVPMEQLRLDEVE